MGVPAILSHQNLCQAASKTSCEITLPNRMRFLPFLSSVTSRAVITPPLFPLFQRLPLIPLYNDVLAPGLERRTDSCISHFSLLRTSCTCVPRLTSAARTSSEGAHGPGLRRNCLSNRSFRIPSRCLTKTSRRLMRLLSHSLHCCQVTAQIRTYRLSNDLLALMLRTIIALPAIRTNVTVDNDGLALPHRVIHVLGELAPTFNIKI